MFFLSPDETLAVLTAAFLGGALFGRIVWRRKAFDESIRTAAGALLRRAEERLRLVQDTSPDGFALMHPIVTERAADFEFAYLNPAWEHFTGRTPASLVGRRFSEVGSEIALARVMEALAELAEGAAPYHDELSLKRNGDDLCVALTAVRIDDAIAVTLADVTARKQAEAMLAASNAELERRVEQRTIELADARERYRLLAEHASDMISTHALDGTFTYAAPALEALLGQSTEQLKGVSALSFAAAEDRELMAAGTERAMRTKAPALVTWRCRRPDGSYVWLETSGRAVRDPATGQPLWFVCASRDVTARKRIEDLRAEGKVGSSLQAEVDFHLSGADYDLLAGLGDDLKFVMLTSAARVHRAAEARVDVAPSALTKCERCWHYRDDVGADAAHAGLCGRCVSNLYGKGEARRYA